MKKFIGRKQELDALENLYQKNGFQMTVIYGRRRIGKSTLIQEFIKNKKSVYFTSIKNGLGKNVLLWSQMVIRELASDMPGISLSSIESILTFLGAKCEKERIVIVIDELPYLAEADPTFLSVLQNFIDHTFINGNMMLILCGSSVSFMENEVLSEKSPVFGRRTSQIRLLPFDYIDSALFTPDYSAEEKAICYGITGGVAKYLSLLDDSKSLDTNIVNLFFDKSGYLYEETSNLLTQEFRNVRTYNDILNAISEGANKLNEISDKTHIDASTISHAIKNLISTGILSKNMAITDESNKKKVQYNLSDHMFRFWFKFVPDGMPFIEMGKGTIYYERYVKSRIHEYMGITFEDMCRHYTLLVGIEGKLPLLISAVGKWWGSNPKTREQTDIDVVALDKISGHAIIGECKFKNEYIDKSIYDELKARNHLISNKYEVSHYMLFSLSGFSKWFYENGNDKYVTLITLDDMYNVKK